MKEQSFLIQPWELIALWVVTGVAAVALLVAGLLGAPRLLEGVLELPSYVWAGLGYFLLVWAPMPLASIQARSRRGRGVRILTALVASVAGAILGAVLFALLA